MKVMSKIVLLVMKSEMENVTRPNMPPTIPGRRPQEVTE
jgi:hypothetical protein